MKDRTFRCCSKSTDGTLLCTKVRKPRRVDSAGIGVDGETSGTDHEPTLGPDRSQIPL